jgi:antitoxin FitA
LLKEVSVASLVIRELDEDLKARLRMQAAEHGRSMEAEARAILGSALNGRRPPRGLGSHIRKGFADLGGVELELPPRTGMARVADVE